MLKSLLKPEIKKWLEKSAESEMYAHHLYQHIANNLQRIGLFGAQAYFISESNDELTHYRKLADFVNDMGDCLIVPAAPKMTDEVKSLKDALEIAYETELGLMKQYQEFYEEAEDKYYDCITATFIIEYLQIQRASVGEFADFIARLELGGDIYQFDKELKKLAA